MTEIRQDITEHFYAGNTKTIQVTIYNLNGTRKELTGAELTYVIVTDAGLIVVAKSSANGIGEIEVSDPANGIAIVKLIPADTTSLAGTYRHQMNVVDSGGVEETVMVGKVSISRAYSRRFRSSSIHGYLNGIEA